MARYFALCGDRRLTDSYNTLLMCRGLGAHHNKYFRSPSSHPPTLPPAPQYPPELAPTSVQIVQVSVTFLARVKGSVLTEPSHQRKYTNIKNKGAAGLKVALLAAGSIACQAPPLLLVSPNPLRPSKITHYLLSVAAKTYLSIPACRSRVLEGREDRNVLKNVNTFPRFLATTIRKSIAV